MNFEPPGRDLQLFWGSMWVPIFVSLGLNVDLKICVGLTLSSPQFLDSFFGSPNKIREEVSSLHGHAYLLQFGREFWAPLGENCSSFVASMWVPVFLLLGLDLKICVGLSPFFTTILGLIFLALFPG